MSTAKQTLEAQQDLVRAVDDLAHIVATNGPGPVFGDRGYRSHPVLPDWAARAIRFCRNGDDGLARYFRVVPEEHRGPTADDVICVCGQDPVMVPEREFVECPGSCGRWFLRDDERVWAARLPQDDS